MTYVAVLDRKAISFFTIYQEEINVKTVYFEVINGENKEGEG